MQMIRDYISETIEWDVSDTLNMVYGVPNVRPTEFIEVNSDTCYGPEGTSEREMGLLRQCEVCHGAQSKYKCPSCFLPYCSLTCFKKHKEVPCKAPLPLEEKTEHALVLPERLYQVDELSSVLPTEEFRSIAESSGIRDALKDEHVRNLIYGIDCSKDPEGELDKAMEGQIFRDFTDKILSIVSPQV